MCERERRERKDRAKDWMRRDATLCHSRRFFAERERRESERKKRERREAGRGGGEREREREREKEREMHMCKK